MPSPVRVSGAQGIAPPGPLLTWLQAVEQAVNRLGEARAYAIFVPVSGFSQLIPNGVGLCLLTPAGSLSSGNVTLPAQASDGFEQTILSTQAVSSLTIAASSGQTLVGPAATSLAAGVQVVYRFAAANSAWYRMV